MPYGQKIKVSVVVEGGEAAGRGVGYFRAAGIREYNAFESPYLPYVWFPVGIFATSFETDEAGLEFSAFPIGIAAGFKVGFKRREKLRGRYVGLSLAISYAISRAGVETTEGAPPSKDFFLKTAGVGLILDINAFVFAGPAYVINFDDPGNSPGPMLMLGVGAGLLRALSGSG